MFGKARLRQDVESGAGRVLLKTLNLNTYKLLYTDSGSEISAYRLTSASVLHQLDKPQFILPQASAKLISAIPHLSEYNRPSHHHCISGMLPCRNIPYL